MMEKLEGKAGVERNGGRHQLQPRTKRFGAGGGHIEAVVSLLSCHIVTRAVAACWLIALYEAVLAAESLNVWLVQSAPTNMRDG